MMFGHGAKPIFFIKKKKEWTSRTLANPPSSTSHNISFLPYPPPPLPPHQSERHMCINPNYRFIQHPVKHLKWSFLQK